MSAEPARRDDKEAERERRKAEEERRRTVATTFVREVSVLFLGIGIGYVWRVYTEEAATTYEANIIVLLLIVVFCLGRYIALIQK